MKVGYKGPVVSPGGFPGELLVTGQTTQYSSKEDDGYHQKGISKSYTVLSTGNYSGTTAIVLNGKTHNLSNNCVIDNQTGLMWARYVPLANIGPDNNGKLYWIDDTNDEDVFDFKDAANTGTLGGHGDWRVPNIQEMRSLMKAEGVSPFIDQTTFPSTPGAVHWSSTTAPWLTARANVFDFSVGADRYDQVKATSKQYCRLVRGGG